MWIEYNNALYNLTFLKVAIRQDRNVIRIIDHNGKEESLKYKTEKEAEDTWQRIRNHRTPGG